MGHVILAGMGRPKLAPDVKRSEEIKLRLTPAGRRRLERMAQFRGHDTPAGYVLSVLSEAGQRAASGCRGHMAGDECGRCGIGP